LTIARHAEEDHVVSSGSDRLEYDVAIIGGGPGGSTAGTMLKKYRPSVRVAIFEKEKFPREHIGESQLPPISGILDEMGCWDRVEAAGFPIKVGATYRWGASRDLWDFEFLPIRHFKDEPRPAKFEGQRRLTAFQVERAIYDDILLKYAREMGCDVYEETRVDEVMREGDRVTGLRLRDGRTASAKWYLDCSGHVGILRRAMDVKIDVPTNLRNMAIWDYWENAEWAAHIGVGGTRIQILSISCGWIWFIPLGPTRTSIGFVCQAERYRAKGMSPEQLYEWALAQEPRVIALTRNATRSGEIRTTKDWSFVSERMTGPNWMLIGEAAGFADPILSGGMTLAHMSAREAAFAVLAMLAGEQDPKWLLAHYQDIQQRRVRQYIRFADFWYAANGENFSEVEAYTAEIAKGSGLDLSPKAAFRWLSFGGFSHEDWFLPGLGGFDFLAVKELARIFTSDDDTLFQFTKFNVLKLNLLGAQEVEVPLFNKGGVIRAKAYKRGGRILPNVGMYAAVIDALKQTSDVIELIRAIGVWAKKHGMIGNMPLGEGQAWGTIESMLHEGWIVGKVNPKRPMMKPESLRSDGPADERGNFHPNRDRIAGLDQASAPAS
jgi:flavin-dependent dehydrogenase